MSSRETRQAPRPRNPHEAMNRPVEKSKDFSGSFKRLIGELRPDYWFVSIALIAAVFSVAFNVAAPKVLGKGTDIIFNGVVSKMIAQAPSKEAAVAALEAQGKTDLARMLDSMDITPGAGIDFDALGSTPDEGGEVAQASLFSATGFFGSRCKTSAGVCATRCKGRSRNCPCPTLTRTHAATSCHECRTTWTISLRS